MATLNKTWKKKKEAVYNLRDNIDRLKYRVRNDLNSDNEKDRLTALVVRIMIITSERVGNEESEKSGHFGITGLKNNHINIIHNVISLKYTGKSGVKHEKSFSDAKVAQLLKSLKTRNKNYLFKTLDGFRIKADRINRYLAEFDIKSKDIRGFNCNKIVIGKLKGTGRVSEKMRVKIFNRILTQVAEKIGHTPATLRNHYLLPDIEEHFYKYGTVNTKI